MLPSVGSNCNPFGTALEVERLKNYEGLKSKACANLSQDYLPEPSLIDGKLNYTPSFGPKTVEKTNSAFLGAGGGNRAFTAMIGAIRAYKLDDKDLGGLDKLRYVSFYIFLNRTYIICHLEFRLGNGLSYVRSCGTVWLLVLDASD